MILLNWKEVEFKQFANGEQELMTDALNLHIGKTNEIQFKYETDGDLIKLLFVKKYIDAHNVSALKHAEKTVLTITYMPYSRMDRVEEESAFTLKYISEFINSLNFDLVYIYEAHSDVTPALVNRSFNVPLTSFILPKVMEAVDFNPERDVVFYPDAGAQKRYGKLHDGKTLVGYKKRDLQTHRITDFKLVGEVPEEGFDVIIVDDLSSFGGTFVLAAEHLKAAGARNVYLVVAHAEDSIYEGDLLKKGTVDRVFTTDSLLTKHNFFTAHTIPLTVYPLEDLIL